MGAGLIQSKGVEKDQMLKPQSNNVVDQLKVNLWNDVVMNGKTTNKAKVVCIRYEVAFKGQ